MPSYAILNARDYTWANRPLATAVKAGTIIRVSDMAAGVYFVSDGVRWRPLNGYAALATLDADSAAIPDAETIVFQKLIPAGMWQVNDLLRVTGYVAKSGTTDTMMHRIRIGTAGTTADAQISSVTVLSAGQRSSGITIDVRLASVTSAVKLGGAGAGTGSPGGSSVAHASGVTIPDASADGLYVSSSIQSSSTNDTVQLMAGSRVELLAGAN